MRFKLKVNTKSKMNSLNAFLAVQAFGNGVGSVVNFSHAFFGLMMHLRSEQQWRHKLLSAPRSHFPHPSSRLPTPTRQNFSWWCWDVQW